MTGRGDGRIRHPSKNPPVTIGLRLSTEPPALSASTDDDFCVVVTARILTTPQENASITLSTFLTPLMGLSHRSYTNIVRVDSKEFAKPAPHPRIPGLMPVGFGHQDSDDPTAPKVIELWPRAWPQHLPPLPNLRSQGEFVTVPPTGHGVLTLNFKVPREKIDAAKVEPEERYRVSLTDKYLGTDWWGFGDFQGKRLRAWEPPEQQTSIEDLKKYYQDLEWWDHVKNIKEGEGDWERGEKPDELAFVIEDDGKAGVVEFEVVE